MYRFYLIECICRPPGKDLRILSRFSDAKSPAEKCETMGTILTAYGSHSISFLIILSISLMEMFWLAL